MKFSSFQPYFFPYLGQFDLIHSVDIWVVADQLQYIRRGWINRNRILHPARGWTYLNVPIKAHHHKAAIMDIEIVESDQWKRSILGQLSHYRHQAPFYRDTVQLVERCLENDTHLISRLNVWILGEVCAKLGIRFNYYLETELNLKHDPGTSLSDQVCLLARVLGADEFINPPGGAHLYDAQRFSAHGVKLTIQSFSNMVYSTGRYDFEPALSIIDVLMWNSTAEIMRHLEHA